MHLLISTQIACKVIYFKKFFFPKEFIIFKYKMDVTSKHIVDCVRVNVLLK